MSKATVGRIVDLPGNSGTMKDGDIMRLPFPLPKDHWLYDKGDDAECEPLFARGSLLEKEITWAIKHAIRGATGKGTTMDFDPDAMVLCAMYNLFGAAHPPLTRVHPRTRLKP